MEFVNSGLLWYTRSNEQLAAVSINKGTGGFDLFY